MYKKKLSALFTYLLQKQHVASSLLLMPIEKQVLFISKTVTISENTFKTLNYISLPQTLSKGVA